MNTQTAYGIGTPGKKWTDGDKETWLSQQQKKRSYYQQVVTKLEDLGTAFTIEQYGNLLYGADNYPLYAVKSSNWQADKPTILITGGVHGYETSGVQGAIRFITTAAAQYEASFNFVVLPCISPWGYETINRWNPLTLDPNRSFYEGSLAQESAAVMQYIKNLSLEFLAHIDLHETTDSDNTEFRPALAARDAIEQKNWNIPDGFYLVADSTKPQANFQKAIIDSVAKVTHIAPADQDNKLIGVQLAQFGVINYAARELGLCMGLTDAPYVTTTEVYPDSPKVDDENCILAQVAVITGALDFLLTL
ncbi:Succinylglutamate desuccinylase / Aspartoacylase family protein [Colwellia chukchiensis]|uniref:Succinylglutamate desuccinylase / Aspartoacylase family protein n=1 Tax=Colwellia chukchiensis TaxID=641665 RepID=A0A1H7R5X5_9GAMM|nr:M14 family metallocarboxypeptidase [Colwellia chukchiensis]SEL55314.1 Succinylglutamate desuccinylase / Aspartoacylase family protein [Colwellia chukchiensis]